MRTVPMKRFLPLTLRNDRRRLGAIGAAVARSFDPWLKMKRLLHGLAERDK